MLFRKNKYVLVFAVLLANVKRVILYRVALRNLPFSCRHHVAHMFCSQAILSTSFMKEGILINILIQTFHLAYFVLSVRGERMLMGFRIKLELKYPPTP